VGRGSVPDRRRLVLSLRSPLALLMGRHGCPVSCPHPQRVPLLLACRTPCLGSVLHAHTRVNQSLARARCPIVCTSLSHHPSAALTALQELLHQSLKAALIALLKQLSSRLKQSPLAASAAPAVRHPAPVLPVGTTSSGSRPAASLRPVGLASRWHGGVAGGVPVARGGAGGVRGGAGGSVP